MPLARFKILFWQAKAHFDYGRNEAKLLDYAMSVIVARALPDVRDGGLKHRRILYSMYKSGIHYILVLTKSARIVGDVLGKYHPMVMRQSTWPWSA